MSKRPTPTAYRPCVGVMLFNTAGRVWVGRRRDMPSEEGGANFWQMPQGGIDPDEDPAKAARRELFEETGIRSAEIIAESGAWHRYDLPAHLIGVSWGGRYRGQEQKWFAMRFTGEDREIDLAPAGHKAEFDMWQWAAIEELTSLIVPFKRDVYAKVINEFRHLSETA
ncbi:MAG: RNA pyrophosphohydrolase [Hyphomicrobiaceae bacterium]